MSVTLSGVGVTAPQSLGSFNFLPGGQPVNSPGNPYSNLGSTIIVSASTNASLVYNIEFSNDGINFVPDLASTGLTAATTYTLAGFVNFWRLNMTSYVSGSISGSAATP